MGIATVETWLNGRNSIYGPLGEDHYLYELSVNPAEVRKASRTKRAGTARPHLT